MDDFTVSLRGRWADLRFAGLNSDIQVSPGFIQVTKAEMPNRDGAFRKHATECFLPVDDEPKAFVTTVPDFVTVASWSMGGLSGGRRKADPAVKAAYAESLGADILALQKTDAPDQLEQFCDQYPDLKRAYPYRLVVTASNYPPLHQSSRIEEVAILTQFRILRAYSYHGVKLDVEKAKAGETLFVHPPLLAVVEVVPGLELSVLVCDFISTSNQNMGKHRRHVETQMVGSMIADHMSDFPKCLLVVAGGFSDTPDSKAVQAVRSDILQNPYESEGRDRIATYKEYRHDQILVNSEFMKWYESGSAYVIESPSEHAALMTTWLPRQTGET